eukprot:m51a1_g13294 hypothetical protein (115) ;mRNA; r:217-561
MPCSGAVTPRDNAVARDFDAVLFDMDETLVHSTRVWYAGEERLWSALGSHYNSSVAAHFGGLRCDRIAEYIMDDTDPAVRPSELTTVAQCADYLRSSLLKGKPRPDNSCFDLAF